MTHLPNGMLHPNRGDGVISAGGDVNGVTVVKETIGVTFLGLLTIFLLIALLRAQARNRELLIQLGQQNRS
ncbi:MAG TPA: hypothetical protein VMP08_14880 [Anaerolineae bacterium]|nr:hypothetical protein [Anaerolineae bacterium]